MQVDKAKEEGDERGQSRAGDAGEPALQPRGDHAVPARPDAEAFIARGEQLGEGDDRHDVTFFTGILSAQSQFQQTR